METLVQILHLEDDAKDAELVQAMLESADIPCRIEVAQTRDQFVGALQADTYDIILADYRLPAFDGVSALRWAREHCPDVPFVFVSGTMGEDAAIEGLTEGATDYVLKEKLSRLVPAVKRAIGEIADRRRRRRAEEALRASEERFRTLFENSPVPMWEEDFSAVKSLLDGLREKGVADLEGHLNEYPEVLHQCVERVRVTDFNQAAMKMHRAASREELLCGLVGTFAPDSYATFQRELLCLWDGETEMATDGVVQTLDGDRREVTLYWSVMPGYERTFSKILLSIIDITDRKRTEETLRNISAGVSATTGEAFFRSLVGYLAKALDADCAFVGELVGENRETIRTIAVWANGELRGNFEYELAGTPCEHVVGREVHSYPQGVQTEFPGDRLLAEMGAESYVGSPVFDSADRPLGVAAVVDSKVLENPKLAETMLQIFAVRASAELERRRAEAQQRANQAQLRSLVSQLVAAEERERKKLAGVLHDDFIQNLALCKLRLDRAAAGEGSGKMDTLLGAITDGIRELITSMRSLTFDLCSPILYDIGLEAAIRDWLDNKVQGRYNIAFVYEDDGQIRCLDEDMRVFLFRAVRELCTNVIKHSEAQHATVSIRTEKEMIRIDVKDDGVGLAVSARKAKGDESGGLGLFSIRERLDHFGAAMDVVSPADGGTWVTVMAPLSNPMQV